MTKQTQMEGVRHHFTQNGVMTTFVTIPDEPDNVEPSPVPPSKKPKAKPTIKVDKLIVI